MATFSNTLRSGLPRVSGGDPWPPEGTVGQAVEWESRDWVSAEAGAAESAGAVDSGAVGSGAVTEVTADETSTVDSVGSDATGVEPGLDSGVDSGVDETVAVEADGGSDVEASVGASSGADVSNGAGAQDVAAGAGAGAAVGAGAAAAAVADDPADSAPAAEVALRRGLPRVSGGESWPPEGFAPAGVKAPAHAGGAAAAGAASTEPGVPSEPDATGPGGGEAAVEQISSADETFADDASAEDAVAGAELTESASGAEETDAAAVVAGAGAAAGAGVAGAGIAAASAGGDAATVPLRRGLPRRSGGDAWPPEGVAPAGVKGPSTSAMPPAAAAESAAPGAGEQTADSAAADAVPADAVAAAETTSVSSAGAEAPGGAAPASSAPAAAELSDVPLRRGLPRTAGGDPWPAEGFAPATATAGQSASRQATAGQATAPADAQSTTAPTTAPAADATGAADTADTASTAGVPAAAAGAAASASADTAEKDSADTASAADESATPAGRTGLPKTRTGLPKSTGPDTGKPGDKPAGRTGLPKTGGPATKPAEKPAAKTPGAKPAAAGSTAAAATASAGTAAKSTADSTAAKSTASAKPASAKPASAKRDPIMIGSKSLGQWIGLGSLGLGGLIVAAGILILAARGVTTLPGVPGFLERYPGEYHLPDFVEPGFPAWARWTHFLNFFFMVLIIRTGLQVRHQQKPPAFYTPKNGGKKISINLWLHTSLDVLWLLNGVVFVVLLFVSGHWARIVPTSWEVFPNALSAMLQYMTLEWPMEDAWVNYNSLQQLMYFIVVFIAAPLAAITGVRMSEWWPKNATTLNRIYPAPLARAIHFPTMIFFVFFIAVHVFLVFTTGLRQNLGYMFAGTNVVGWAGLIWFLVALAVVVGAWFAARPLVLAPIANLFGRVSSR